MQCLLFILTIINLLYVIMTFFIDNDENIFTVSMVFPPFISFILLITGSVYLFFRRKTDSYSHLIIYVFVINGLIFLMGMILMRNF